jgi:hypothetical protein
MNLLRSVEPELLDELAADDQRAVRARRDLKRLNAFILQSGIMASALERQFPDRAPRKLLDLGTGDGTFMLSVARRLGARWRGVTATLLDRQSIVSRETRDAFAALGWTVQPVSADVREHLGSIAPASVDVITTNLFLHHFQPEVLADLFRLAARSTGLLVACEPRRTRFALRSARLLWAIGLNDVSLHDAKVSVRAGFDGTELSALWPDREAWDLEEGGARLFAHRFVARARR